MCLPQLLTRDSKILTLDWQKSCVFWLRILQLYPPPSAPSYARNEHSSKFVQVVFVMDFQMSQIYTKLLLSSFWHESVPSIPNRTLWTWSGTRAVQGKEGNPARNIQVQKRLVDPEQLHAIVYHDLCKEWTEPAHPGVQDGFQQVAHCSGRTGKQIQDTGAEGGHWEGTEDTHPGRWSAGAAGSAGCSPPPRTCAGTPPRWPSAVGTEVTPQHQQTQKQQAAGTSSQGQAPQQPLSALHTCTTPGLCNSSSSKGTAAKWDIMNSWAGSVSPSNSCFTWLYFQ